MTNNLSYSAKWFWAATKSILFMELKMNDINKVHEKLASGVATIERSEDCDSEDNRKYSQVDLVKVRK